MSPERARHLTGPDRSWVAVLGRGLVAAPDRLVLTLFWFSLVVTGALLAGAFRAWLVLPVAVAVTVATWRVAPTAIRPTRSAVIGATGRWAWPARSSPSTSPTPPGS